MRIFPILLGAGAAAVLGVTAFASEAHPSNHGADVSVVAQSASPGPGHGAAVSAVARQNHSDTDREEVVAKTTPRPAVTPNVSAACAAAIAHVKDLRAADAAEDAAERNAARTDAATEAAEDAAERTEMINAVKAAWTACRNTTLARWNVCSEAKEALARFTTWQTNRQVQISSTITTRIQQAIAQACA
jgi:hypothetical protein